MSPTSNATREFLPWCLAARIRKREGNVVYADLIIGFKMIRERFTCRVTLDRPDRIDVAYTEGPFRYLNNHWIFEPTEDGGCLIDFYVDFEFRSKMLQKIIGVLFNEAVRRMVAHSRPAPASFTATVRCQPAAPAPRPIPA